MMRPVPDVVIIGNVTLDWIISAAGEYNVKGCGGNTLYAAAGAHLWQKQIGIVSRVGVDFPQAYLDNFQKAEIDLGGVQRLPEKHELVVAYRYDQEGTRHEFDPTDLFITPDNQTPLAEEDHLLFHVDSYSTEVAFRFDPLVEDVPAKYWQASGFHIGGMRHRSHSRFIQKLSEQGKLFTYDPGGLDGPKEERQRILQYTPIILPSLAELDWIANSSNPEHAVEELGALGPELVVVKLGGRGSLVYDKRRRKKVHVPAYPARLKDPTGAGDSYCGGFLVGMCETGDPFEAAIRATVASSFIIEGFNADYALSIPKTEVDRRANYLRKRAR